MRATRTDSEESNGRRTTATYSCDTSGFGYSIITDDIKNDFNFLINELPQKLDNAMTELNNAAAIDNAFDFENQARVHDLTVARDEIQRDINALKNELSLLHSAFMTDINNINLELEYNFGWILIGEVKGSSRTEVIETEGSTK